MGHSEHENIAQTHTREELISALAIQIASSPNKQSVLYRLLARLLDDTESILDKSGYGRIGYVFEAGQLVTSECMVSEKHK